MTAERCPQCDIVVNADATGPLLRCGSCGMRFARARKARERSARNIADDSELGIHPALARRYQRATPEAVADTPPDQSLRQGLPLPSVQLSPSFVDEAQSPFSPGPPAEGEHDDAPTAVESLPGVFEGLPPVSSSPLLDPILPKRVNSTRPLRPSLEQGARGQSVETPVQRAVPRGPRPRMPLPSLPGFDVLEQIGKGAMGHVYKARTVPNGELVALKLLAPDLAARPDFVARFEREAAALKRVNHPGVVAIMDSGVHEDRHFLVMRYVEGVSLRRIIETEQLTPGRALEFARQIIQGLGAAHDKGVIHRDLKPENILVERADSDDAESTERLVLVDFGLAGIIDEHDDPHPNLTKSRMTMGTVNYMAPEQRTDAKRVDQRADLYAAGVILYELLTGDLPLGRFALPRERGLPLPESLDDCVHKALARNQDERFRNAAEFDRALSRIQQELSRAVSMDTLVGRTTADSSGLAGEEEDSLDTDLPRRIRGLHGEADEFGASSLAVTSPGIHVAPAWVHRRDLVLGVLALILGACGALVFAGERAGGKRIRGPAVVTEYVDGEQVAALYASPQEDWRQQTMGWGTEEHVTWYRGEPAPPATPAVLASTVELEEPGVSVRVELQVPSPSPGLDGRQAYAGLLLETDDHHAVGVVRFADGSCGVLEMNDTAAKVAPFRCDATPQLLPVFLRCLREEGRCFVQGGSAAPAEYSVDLGTDDLHVAFACAGGACAFETQQRQAGEP